MKKMGKSKKNLIIVSAIVCAVALSAVLLPTHSEAEENETIADGISIEGVDVSGMTLEEANEVVSQYVAQFSDVPITLTAGDKSYTVTAADLGITAKNSDVASQALNYGKSGNLLERFKAAYDTSKGKDFQISLTVDAATAKQFFKDHASDVNTNCQNATLAHVDGEFTFVEGTEGTTVLINKSVTKLTDFVQNEWDGSAATVALVTKQVEPEGTSEELSVIHDLLGTYSTDYSTSQEGRRTNVENGASKMNGTVVYPGEEISVADTVGPIEEWNGYALGGAYENGTLIESVGGGICQISTTVYNAVMRAELEVVTRYAHSMVVSYVEPSQDAAIAGDGKVKDFVFKNNLDYPIYIEMIANGKTVTCSIYGVETRDSGRSVDFQTEITSQTDPGVEYVATADQPIGYLEKTQGSHTGYTAKLWKIVYQDGVETERSVYNNSTYRAANEIYTVGVASDNAEATAAINAAIATQDLATIQKAISKWTGGSADATDGTSSEANAITTVTWEDLLRAAQGQ